MHAQRCTTPAAVICLKALPFKSAACTMDCDHVLNIGMFFDGTGNNRKIDLPSNRQSNVARLYDAYRKNMKSVFATTSKASARLARSAMACSRVSRLALRMNLSRAPIFNCQG